MAEKITFFNIKTKKPYVTSEYITRIVDTPRGPRRLAQSITPKGVTVSKFLPDKKK